MYGIKPLQAEGGSRNEFGMDQIMGSGEGPHIINIVPLLPLLLYRGQKPNTKVWGGAEQFLLI